MLLLSLLLLLLLSGMVLLAGGMVSGPEVGPGVVLLVGVPLLPLGPVALGVGGAVVLFPTSTLGLPNLNAAQPSMSALPLT